MALVISSPAYNIVKGRGAADSVTATASIVVSISWLFMGVVCDSYELWVGDVEKQPVSIIVKSKKNGNDLKRMRSIQSSKDCEV